MAWWNSISKLLNLRVVCRSCLLLSPCYSMVAACYVFCHLVALGSCGCIDCEIFLLDLVDGIFLLATVTVVLVCDRVLRSGALLLTVGLTCAFRLLRTLFLVIIWFFSGRSSCSIVDGFSTLITAVGGTLGSIGVSLVMFLVIRLSSSSNVCIVRPLGIAWVIPSYFFALVGGDVFADLAMASLCLTAFSVSCTSCFI